MSVKSPLTPAQIERQAAYLRSVPVLSAGIVERAISGKSRAAAVRAKCLDCCHWSRAEAAACSVVTCPLFEFNVYRDGGAADPNEEMAQEPPAPLKKWPPRDQSSLDLGYPLTGESESQGCASVGTGSEADGHD